MLSKDIIEQATREAVRLGSESPSIEFKGSAPFEKVHHGITKAALGISNTRDGGYIVVGIRKEKGKPPVRQGVAAADAQTFDPELVYEFINKFASPPLEIQVVEVEVDGKNYVTIVVPPFGRTPTICRIPTPKDVPKEDEMRPGDVFIRPLNRIETRRVQSGAEMDELLQFALARRASELFGALPQPIQDLIARTRVTQSPDVAADEEHFDKEVSDIDKYIS